MVDNTNSKNYFGFLSLPPYAQREKGKGARHSDISFLPLLFFCFSFPFPKPLSTVFVFVFVVKQSGGSARETTGCGWWVPIFLQPKGEKEAYFSSSLRAVIAVVAENVVMTAVRVQELVGSLGFFFAHFLPPGYRGGEGRENDKKIIAKKGRGNASCSVPNWRNSLTRRVGPKKMKYRVFLGGKKHGHNISCILCHFPEYKKGGNNSLPVFLKKRLLPQHRFSPQTHVVVLPKRGVTYLIFPLILLFFSSSLSLFWQLQQEK